MVAGEDLKLLAEQRLREAITLLSAGHNSGAYYLAGYAIELGLKVRIAGSFRPNVIPPKDFVNRIYTHDFDQLVGLAGLRRELNTALKDSTFAARWGLVCDWSESSRYELRDVMAATAMVAECGEVLKWIRRYW